MSLTVRQQQELTEGTFPMQSMEKQEVVHRVMGRYAIDRMSMDQSFRLFRNRTPIDYWDDSEQRFNYYKIKDKRKFGWQNNVFDPVTHDKTIAIIAGLAARRMGIRAKPRKSRTYRAKFQAAVLSSIYEYTEQFETNGDADHFFDVLETTVKGTRIKFEGFEQKTFKRKMPTMVDEETGEMRYEEKDVKKENIVSTPVELSDFIPGNVYEFDMEKQTHCYWRKIISYAEFRRDWKNWTGSDMVLPGMKLIEQAPFFEESSLIDSDQVEIVRYFDVVDDEFQIMANGILLTPLVSPIRREDKRLGFYKMVFEPFKERMFWGRSFPDKIMQMQDVDNTLLNAMLDQLYLSIFKPILTTQYGNLTQDRLYANSTIQVDDLNEVKEMERSGPEAVAFNMFGLVRSSIDSGSVDPIKQGQIPGKGVTATATERAVQSAGEIQTLFQNFIKWGLKEKGMLRFGTIAQFYFRSRKNSENKVFNEFVVENARLLNDKRGEQVIRIKDQKDLSPKNLVGFSKELVTENAQISSDSEIIEVAPSFMKDFQYQAELIVEDLRVTESLRKAFTREFVTVALSRPDLYDQQVAATKFAEVMEQDADEVVLKPTDEIRLPSDVPARTPGSELANELVPANKSGTPSLKSLISENGAKPATNV